MVRRKKRKRKSTPSESKLSQFKKKHTRLNSTLLNLKLQYEHGDLSYGTYSRLYDFYLHGSDPNKLNQHYSSNMAELKEKIALERQKRHVAHEKRLIKATKITLLVFVFFLAGALLMLV